ncbi:MAG: class I SAM-dependent methyltransferase [Methylibium sp.]|uniref:class I SAM-dependent DNA methyltransferase n=1 Tax=Methylibium sp. TaxID=2067992 RepID=UPI0018406106|nr:class I SAM-dependent methyltransferase [Methylibium sp.]MBA3598751.1 class I SAM-dependent methyltransferase [Methylibium sp.]
MNAPIHNISFPVSEPGALAQNEAYFLLREEGREVRLRFHDYDDIYRRPGLYEQLFYQRLRCDSPRKAHDVLTRVLQDNQVELSSLRVLDLGAGNGMVGELLDAARVVGVDISQAARDACERDRPNAYDAYYVADMSQLDRDTAEEMKRWQIDCLTCIAALGFGDIPVPAFASAFNLVRDGGWAAFNIKETFLHESDRSGFSRLVKYLLVSDTLEVHHLERYRHRLSIDGEPLFYYVLVGRKRSDIAKGMIAECSPF